MPDKFQFKTAEKVEYDLIWRKPHEKYNADGGLYKELGQKKRKLIRCFSPKLVYYYKH